ncbi:MAG: hypothetical protein AB7J32_23860 [Pseudonocardia sp.]|mgnify:CR=1 FL=1
MPAEVQLRNSVAGAFVEPADGACTDVADPATGEMYAPATE